MTEAQVRTVEQVRQVLEGTQAREFRRTEDDEGRYRWIGAVLRRFDDRQLPRGDRAPVLARPATACVLRRQRDVFGDARNDALTRTGTAHG